MYKVGIRILFLVLCLTVSELSYSKTEFLPGYVIDLQNDTIRGLIEYDEWTYTPDDIGFKPGKMRSTVYYSPKDITGFGVNDKQYVSAIVQKEISPYRDDELEKNPALQLTADTVFLQTLVGGEKSLYSFIDWDGKEHFYINEDSTFTLLLHKTYIEYVNNIRKEYHNMRFIAQLSRYFWDEPSLLSKIAESYYTRASLEELFRIYLKQPNKKPTYLNVDRKVSTQFGVVAGVSYTVLRMESDYFKAGFGPSTNFTGGLFADLAMKGMLHDWSMYNEILYTSYYTKNYVGYLLPSNWAIFDFKYLKINSMVRYKPSWFYLNAGISNGWCIHHYNTELADIRSYEIGVVFGAGINYKHFSLELREDIGDGISPYVNIGTETYRLQLLLGYNF